jgi:hypothetical protein
MSELQNRTALRGGRKQVHTKSQVDIVPDADF